MKNKNRPGARWAFMERFDVPEYDHPEHNYLTRWRIMATPWFSVLVHRMDGPDSRPTLHDHPWPFVSIVLRGGYSEVRAYGSAPVSVRLVNAKRSTDAHWITSLHRKPTWTLLLTGRRNRTWGYIEPDGTWTRFDEHRHAAEFQSAIAKREAMDP